MLFGKSRLQYVRCNTKSFPTKCTLPPNQTHKNLKKNERIQTCENPPKQNEYKEQNAFTQYTKYTTDELGDTQTHNSYLTEPLIMVSV